MTRTMKAAHIVAPRQLEIVDAPLPRLDPADGEAIVVEMQAGVLCASDFPRFLGGAFDVEFPRPVGDSLHEIIGTVAESTSPRFSPGDRVLAIPPNQCGYSEYFYAEAGMAVPLPEHDKPEHLILAQPLGTILWAARKLPNLLHQNVVVIGQGPIGLLFDSLLTNMGAKRVIGIDRLDYRLRLAHRMRATHTLNVDRDNVEQAVLDLTDGQGADLVVEAVGHQHDTLHMSVRLCRKQGVALLFGVPHAEEYPLPVWEFFRKNLRLIGSVHPDVQRDVPLAMDMIRDGRIDVAPLITHRFGFQNAQEAFTTAIQRIGDPIKVLIEADRKGARRE